MGTLHPNIAPYGELFRCKEGDRIILAVGTDKQFLGLCGVLGMDLQRTTRVSGRMSERVKHRNALAELLAGPISQRPRNMTP